MGTTTLLNHTSSQPATTSGTSEDSEDSQGRQKSSPCSGTGMSSLKRRSGCPADHFGEQTYSKRGKGGGGIKGVSTNDELVAVWVNSFSVCSEIDVAFDEMYGEVNEDLAV